MVLLAFIFVVIIWSTTPLAIQWSSLGAGFLFGATGRMLVGAIFCALLLFVMRRPLPIDRPSVNTYLIGAAGGYASMFLVYWGAQFIPSGLVSVLFGVTPIVMAVMAHIWLGENSLRGGKILGAFLAVLGIAIIFQSELLQIRNGIKGVAAILAAVLIHCASSIWIKKAGGRMQALNLTSGVLLLMAPMYVLTWMCLDGRIPEVLPVSASVSIVYLGIMGSVIGFTLYFYILKHLEASRVALITVITPAISLILGRYLNADRIGLEVWYGVLCVMFALVMHQWGDRVFAKFLTWDKRVQELDPER